MLLGTALTVEDESHSLQQIANITVMPNEDSEERNDVSGLSWSMSEGGEEEGHLGFLRKESMVKSHMADLFFRKDKQSNRYGELTSGVCVDIIPCPKFLWIAHVTEDTNTNEYQTRGNMNNNITYVQTVPVVQTIVQQPVYTPAVKELTPLETAATVQNNSAVGSINPPLDHRSHVGKILVRNGQRPPTGGDYILESDIPTPYRILAPGGMSTMDFVPGRHNIALDSKGHISSWNVEGFNQL
ncbi:hypothetical protein PROFUN_16979 [Planoprotostelium fungivorum]|uniref:Uncharacterized protein n=1 Tax=Planoprotostelium fungivorum TaxID=1890364 RepID=A0A2P6MMY0_9EUKA|nr:hypothetical protein PROFUN_16979 [Planoprotostelium fungivorum]